LRRGEAFARSGFGEDTTNKQLILIRSEKTIHKSLEYPAKRSKHDVDEWTKRYGRAFIDKRFKEQHDRDNEGEGKL
jgi:hypothetical protein